MSFRKHICNNEDNAGKKAIQSLSKIMVAYVNSPFPQHLKIHKRKKILALQNKVCNVHVLFIRVLNMDLSTNEGILGTQKNRHIVYNIFYKDQIFYISISTTYG